MLTDDDIYLVQSSFGQIESISESAASLFYSRLFELNPNLKRLFHSDLKEQGTKLMNALSFIVLGLTDLNKIIPAAESLAIRHNGYGVKQEHYTTVGESLLWTLETGLGDNFSNKHRDAWLKAYSVLSGVMIAAARRSR